MATIDNMIEKIIDSRISEKLEQFRKEQKQKEASEELPKTKLVYTNKELLEMLNVTPRTLKKYRDEGLLAFSRNGDKFYYTEDDIQEFLTRNHYTAFAYSE